MTHRKLLILGTAGALAAGAGACGSSGSGGGSGGNGGGSASNAASSSAVINGAGSTLAQPVYQTWASKLQGQGVQVNYQGVGSGAGVSQLQAGTAAFAGSDPALMDSEAAKLKGKAVHIPPFFGGITVAYNLGGIPAGLRLDGPTLADVYAGKVTKWNDPAIARQNPGKSLPAATITVVHRSDSSGTTKGFTTFLSDYSSSWKQRYGADKTINWPTGTGAKGNDGVAAQVKQTPNAIGYVEQAYALQNGFTIADVKNASGAYVAPTLQSTSAAGEGIAVPADLRFTTINSKNPSAYPIVSQTFVITTQDVCRGAKLTSSQAQGLVKFLDFGLSGQGQGIARQLSYAPLPAGLLAKARQQVRTLRCNGQPIPGAAG